ncbi:unnamed protein product [Schistosoma mattheei]|uniref:Uncharacterized protein n=1 Tax=Schistosoma mattheei TaxID=31246 RepID=A0A183Q4C8_9TREM|nr:unnamed protein product [Schistosoma mattheei]
MSKCTTSIRFGKMVVEIWFSTSNSSLSRGFITPSNFCFYQSDAPPVLCQCYLAIRHRRDGMVIRVKDSVLLCSGPSRSHPPHVAKIVALYHDKNTGEWL